MMDSSQSSIEQAAAEEDESSEFTPADSQLSSAEQREHLRVFLRIRPFTSAETLHGESQDCVSIEPPDAVLLKQPSLCPGSHKAPPQAGQRFHFSQVYGPETTQRELFEGAVKDLVKDVLDGGNSLVFTYGVTNAGKTFTFLGPDADAGILPRSLGVIFSSIDGRVCTDAGVKPHRCQEFTRLSREQQAEEAAFKRNLFRQLKESDRSNASLLNSSNKTLLEDSFAVGAAAAAEDRISLQVETHTKFSVWVSFCEIYNENIHDLLEAGPGGAPKRAALRLSQDVRGHAFVKDLRWVQVSSSDEAYKVMKLGRRNQSFSSTRLNQLSSRSHSIFSVRLLRMEDVGTPRVRAVSELSLCDLAGSERCAKTRNQGERLKEAGNINNSLLILGKCITALRHNQQARLLHHVPYRESKLTHYLQGFFCGRGKTSMIVNVNQCASMYDETLNVLKFSAVAQTVVVPIAPQRAAGDASLINGAERSSRRSSLNGWDSSLEDVLEDEDQEVLTEDTMNQTGDEEDEMIVVSGRTQQRRVELVQRLQEQLDRKCAESELTEARVREEISQEFSELFSQMQRDFDERLARERDILEERAERRLEIFKNLVSTMSTSGPGPDMDAMDKSLDVHSSDVEGAAAADAAERPAAAAQTLKVSGAAGEKRRRLQAESEQHPEQEKRLKDDRLSARETEEEEEALVTPGELREKKEDQRAEEEEERKEVGRLQEERDALRLQVAAETQRAQEASVQLQTARTQLDRRAQEVDSLTRELGRLRQEEEATADRKEQEAAQADQLRLELQEQQETSLRQLEELRRKLDESEKKLQERDVSSQEFKVQLTEGRAKLREDLRVQEELLKELRRANSELQAELASLRDKASNMETPVELQARLQEKEAQVTSLQRSLQEEKERRQEEDSQAVQETRRREVERRRELLAVAHQAIAQKEAELQRRGEEMSRLQEHTGQESQRSQRLELELQRKEDEASDLREKQADYKKQIQQVQKEISTMREEEKLLRQKLSDAEKSKKQLQCEVASRDRSLQQLRAEPSSDSRCERTLQLYQKACEDLKEQQRAMEDMRLALAEQDETQNQMDQVLEEKLHLVQQLSAEVEKLKQKLLQQDGGDDVQPARPADSQSDELKAAKQEAARAQDSLALSAEKHQAERRKWLQEKLALIGQAKEAEDKRNQEMKKFAEERERFARQQSGVESLSSRLADKDRAMETWRKERDALVAALEVQLQKLLSSQAEKDQVIQQLRLQRTQPPQEGDEDAAQLRAALSQREAEILHLQEALKASAEVKGSESSAAPGGQTASAGRSSGGQTASAGRSSGGRKEARASVSSQGSAGCPSVLDSSEISTENGRASRFPRPELEISFSPLQPNRMALRRQGEEDAVTVKISRSARKRKSQEMDKSHFFKRSKRREPGEEEAENRRNMRSRLTTKLPPHQEEVSSHAGRHDSQSSIHSRKEGKLQRIGEFLQSSPTLLGSKAKKMMSLVSGRADADSSSSSSSSSLRAKKDKRRPHRPEISSPMDPSHPIISRAPEETQSRKWSLRPRTAK